MKKKKKILFFVTEDWYFCSHRLPLAVAAKEAGYEVSVVTSVNNHAEIIRNAGINLIPIKLSRRGFNPVSEILLIWKLIFEYRKLKPDIVHHVALKPVLYGSIAARLVRIPNVVNAMAGLGFIFSSKSIKARMLQPIVLSIFKVLLNLKSSSVILQNPDDVKLMCDSGVLTRERITLIRGSGVNIDDFSVKPEMPGELLVVLASRLLWDKGVGEFVAAAKYLKPKFKKVRFVLVGEGDAENPATISDEQLQVWKRDTPVELWGVCKDMPNIFAQSHVVCLPSYREGVPKVLLEAAACGKPIVTTDAPGCREIVRDGINGILVPLKNSSAVASALSKLIESKELRETMGRNGRELVEREFSLAQVNTETLALYSKLLS